METNIQILNANEALEALNKSEIDQQISTAKKFPRNIQTSIEEIRALAMVNENAATECFYLLKRGDTEIEGLSVRFAEMVAYSWGNLRVMTNIIGNDGKKISVRGVCFDLEKNIAISTEVSRRITDKHGRTYSDDMQIVSANAASAIAYRNAVLKTIPKSLLYNTVEEIKQFLVEKNKDNFGEKRDKWIAYFVKQGVKQEQLFKFLEISKIEEFLPEQLIKLQGLYNAIKEGTTTIKESFFPENQNVNQNNDTHDLAIALNDIEKAANTEAAKTKILKEWAVYKDNPQFIDALNKKFTAKDKKLI